MKQQRSRGGYILPMTLLVLSCTLLWGSVLLLNLSDQYAASNAIVKQEQSRLLARSGWNLALYQLDESGSQEAILVEKQFGSVAVQLQTEEENRIHILSAAEAGDYPSVVEGIVYLLELPWSETDSWMVTETMNLTEPGVFCTKSSEMDLNTSVTQPLAVIAQNSQPVQVCVTEPVYCTELFIHGDLIVAEEGFLEADAVYVSGQITGSERITGTIVMEQYTSGTDYHIQLAERLM